MRRDLILVTTALTTPAMAIAVGCNSDGEGSPSHRDADETGPPDAGQSDASQPSAFPEGCEVLEQRRAERADCGGSEAECAQAPVDERPLRYWLQIEDEELDSDDGTRVISDAELTHRIDCLETWLAQMGLEAESTSNAVWVTGDWSAVEDALWLDVVRRYQPMCESNCGCSGLSETECGADAFCASESGRPFDEADNCWMPSTFAGCYPSSQSCDEAESRAKGSDGQCWWFSSICDVTGFDYDDADCEQLAASVTASSVACEQQVQQP